MKVLFLHALADPARGGGAEVIVWEQIRGLQAAGHACALLGTSDRPGLHREQHVGVPVWLAGICNLYWPYDNRARPAASRTAWHAIDSYNPLMQGYLRQVIAAEKPDVISMHNLPGWSAAAWVTAARAGVPAVQVLHDYYAICPKASQYKRGRNCIRQCASCRVFRLPHRALSNRLSAVVGVSQFVLDRHVAEGYFSQVPVRRVIHNARDSRSLGLDNVPAAVPHAGLRFGYIGRLDPPKGIDPLIDAFRSLPHADAELWIAGSGKPDYERALRARAQGDARIRFLGRVAPVEFYPQVDVVVVPSLWNDILPTVVFEAMAYGKPVIGARRGGIPEMIQDGVSGLLFDPDRPDALPMALANLADHRNQIGGIGISAAAARKPFVDTDEVCRKYLNVYSTLGSTR